MVLPDVISKEPLGPVVRHGDNKWGDVVRWSLYAMVEAEEMGLTAANVKGEKANTSDPAKRRLLGVEGNLGENLGLSNDWAFYIISQVGNYGESFARHLGPDTALNIERGLNALWKDGGLQYSMPAR